MYYDCFEYEDKETYLTVDPSIKCEGFEASRWKVSEVAQHRRGPRIDTAPLARRPQGWRALGHVHEHPLPSRHTPLLHGGVAGREESREC